MFALAVVRVIEHRRRRPRSAKGPVVPDIDPASPRVGLSHGQDRNGRVIRMKALGRHDMGFNQAKEKIKRCGHLPENVLTCEFGGSHNR